MIQAKFKQQNQKYAYTNRGSLCYTWLYITYPNFATFQLWKCGL